MQMAFCCFDDFAAGTSAPFPHTENGTNLLECESEPLRLDNGAEPPQIGRSVYSIA